MPLDQDRSIPHSSRMRHFGEAASQVARIIFRDSDPIGCRGVSIGVLGLGCDAMEEALIELMRKDMIEKMSFPFTEDVRPTVHLFIQVEIADKGWSPTACDTRLR